MTSILGGLDLDQMDRDDKWVSMGFTPDEGRRHQAEIDRIVAGLKCDHEWRICASREEMESPTVIREYMKKSYAERDDRMWRENLHAYLDEIRVVL